MQENVCLAKCTCTFGMQSAFPKFLGQCTCGFMNVECQIGRGLCMELLDL